MAERPTAPESLVAKFDQVKTTSDLIRVINELPDTTTFLLANEPRGVDIAPRGKDALYELCSAISLFAGNSSLRHGTGPDSRADRDAFLDHLIKESVIEDGEESLALINAIRRTLIDDYPEYGDGTAKKVPPGEPAPDLPSEPAPFELDDDAKRALEGLGWPPKMIERLTPEKAESILVQRKSYIVLRKVPSVPKAPPAPKLPQVSKSSAKSTTADLSKLMPKKPAAAATAAPAAPTAAATTAVPAEVLTPEAAALNTFDQNPAFRTFFARYPDAEEVIAAQNVEEIEKRRRVFTIKDKLAKDLYELANGAIKGDFLLDFDNPASGLPENQQSKFQEYVDTEAIERPDQLLTLAEQLETRQVLQKNIATEKATLDQLGSIGVLEAAEREALDLKKHLEIAGESARRDTLFAVLPHAVEVGFNKIAHRFNKWRGGWEGQTEATVAAEFEAEKAAILKGRAEDAVTKEEALQLVELKMKERAKVAGLKRHQALGERMVRLADQAYSREVVKDTFGIDLGLANPFSSPINYSLAWWTEHPEIREKMEGVEASIAEIRAKKQTIEHLGKKLAETTVALEALRTATYAELPPTIALVQYAQAQIANTLSSFGADSALEDLQMVYDYATLLESRGPKGENTGVAPFERVVDLAGTADRLHEAVVAQWGKRVFDIFTKTAINKKGAVGEMEKAIKKILKQDAIGRFSSEEEKRDVVKNLIEQVWRNIDPKKGDGKERRMALIGVMVSCGLLKKGQKITTS